MPRPPKKVLEYYRKDTGFYGSFDIMSLMADRGPLGVTIYEVIVDYIFSNGYYLEAPLVSVAAMVRQTVGAKWIRSIDLVLNVIHDCADLGLFDKGLLAQSVLTSSRIQEYYSKITVRNKVDKSKYWLLAGEQEACGSIAKNSVSATETPISATETPISATETHYRNRTEQNRTFIPNRNKNRYGNFDTEEFFNKAVEHSLKKFEEKEKEKNEKADVHSD
jgi:hypothetical protein